MSFMQMPEKILTTSNLEDEQTRSDVCKVADLKVVSDEAEGVVYVDRFGRHRDISMEGDKQPCSTSFEREIVLPTTSSASEVCWDFKHGLCEWGSQCRRIHYLNMQSGVNKRIPKDILQDHAKNVEMTLAFRNEVCKRFLENRCRYGQYCDRIHFASPNRLSSSMDNVKEDRPEDVLQLPSDSLHSKSLSSLAMVTFSPLKCS
ncbi:hypothetical protein F5880DRAFT_276188 [Lentinula raphanica]|nr:hypothetical protein F5880DRAFT_276188 [Lentinula raphanica]